MRVNEVFESIQGEGKYAGQPALFIRLSGCNLKCSFCDSKHHVENDEYSIDELINIITSSDKTIVVWTGGEPLLQYNGIKEVVDKTRIAPYLKQHHIETNGTLLSSLNIRDTFHYICVSPKDAVVAQATSRMDVDDIKVVTDLMIGKDSIPYATMLMPLTTYTHRDNNIEKDVWNYCVEHNKKFCLRQHYKVWNNKKGV